MSLEEAAFRWVPIEGLKDQVNYVPFVSEGV